MKFLFISFLFLFLAACARPDYIDPITPNAKESASSSCPLKFVKAQMCASLEWTQGPHTPDESEFILKFWPDSKQGELADAPETPTVVLWMPAMGHGSAPVTIQKIDPGTYRIGRVYFIMPGEWEIRVALKNADGTTDNAVMKLTL